MEQYKIDLTHLVVDYVFKRRVSVFWDAEMYENE